MRGGISRGDLRAVEFYVRLLLREVLDRKRETVAASETMRNIVTERTNKQKKKTVWSPGPVRKTDPVRRETRTVRPRTCSEPFRRGLVSRCSDRKRRGRVGRSHEVRVRLYENN